MSRKARHLQILEDSKKEEYNINKPTKIRTTIQDTRNDYAREQANLYAKSLGYSAPNAMSYEKNGGKTKRKRRNSKRKNRRTRRSRKYKK